VKATKDGAGGLGRSSHLIHVSHLDCDSVCLWKRLNVKCCEMQCTEVLMEVTMMLTFLWEVIERSSKKM
jgi:hypothetical protein